MPENRANGAILNELLRECFRLNRCLMQASQQLTEGSGVTGAQWGVLTALGQGDAPRTVAETARQMGLARQSVQRVADVLANKGLVRYLQNPEDKRAKLAEVTAAGRELLWQLEELQHEWVNAIATDCSNAEISEAFQSVKKIRQRMEQ